MFDNKEGFLASKELIEFLRQYMSVMEKQLNEIRAIMISTTKGVMGEIEKMSANTEVGKKQAEDMLTNLYLNPDDGAKELVGSIQDAVDDIVNQAQEGAVHEGSSEVNEDEVLRMKIRRFGGVFSKHMEALSTLDDNIKEVLLSIMGALSTDDVIDQKLDHVERSLNALQISLAYVLVDFETRFSRTGVLKLKKELLQYTYRQYTMENERDIHKKIFGIGEAAGLPKAS